MVDIVPAWQATKCFKHASVVSQKDHWDADRTPIYAAHVDVQNMEIFLNIWGLILNCTDNFGST